MALALRVLVIALMWTLCLCAEYTYYYKIQEELPPAHATIFGNIPNDTDLGSMVSPEDFANLQYSFLTEGDTETHQHFSLDENTGILSTSPSEVLDREALCPFESTCVLSLEVAIKSRLNQFFRTVALEISVEDINDNSPTFEKNETTFNIPEGVVTVAPYPLEGAVDRDSANNSLQTYTMEPSDVPFGIQFTKNVDGTSSLNMIVKEKLDHEKQESYTLRIIAHDGGVPPRTGVLTVFVNVVDMNDNKPIFTLEDYNVVVGENVTSNSVILNLTATDEDSGENGRVRYSLSKHQSVKNLNLFSIDADTGELRVTGDLQTEAEEKYDIIVEASDSGVQPHTSRTVVTVTVLDTINSPPRIRVNLLSSLNFSTISEYANLGVVVAHVRVYESDRGRNGIVNCELLHHDFFELQGFDVNEYKVIVARPLDRESRAQHKVTVVCEDAGSPPLSANASFIVKVTDENDNAPLFSKSAYTASIRENNPTGVSVLRVSASDIDEGQNALIRYSILSDRDDFIISAEDGTIIAKSVYNYETRPEINFTVVATDGGSPAKATTVLVTVKVIDINDEKPKFSPSVFHFNVSENALPGQNVGQIVANDFEQGSNGDVFIVLAPEYPKIDPFVLYENGSVFLNGTVDYESSREYEFRVTAIDRGTPPLNSTTYVRISVLDENDNVPVISYPNTTHHSARISTDFQPGYIVATVKAKDKDSGANSRLKYIITSRNDSARFDINPKTGDIIVSKAMSKKDANIYKLMIMVQDEGIPPFATHTLLLITVALGNGSSLFGEGENDLNVLITVTIICVTAVISAIIVLVIIVMRRKDRRRSKVPDGPKYAANPGSMAQFVDKVKVDNVRSQKGDDTTNDDDFGFSSNKKDKENMKNDIKSQQYSLATESGPGEKTGHLDQLTVLQLHQALLQSYQGNQLSNSQKVAAWQRGQDDVHSDASGETTTSDSGRGGSEEDICSHSGNSASHIEDLHELSRDTLLNNTSFQSGQNGPSSLKSVRKDNVRTSVRKHVTFRDLSDKGRCDNYPEFPPNSHHQIPNMDRGYPQTQVPQHPPRGAKTCGFTVRNPTFTNDKFRLGSAKGEFHVPMHEHVAHVRDWRNDSLATTEDGDDRSTTTSGSYTIDNEDGVTLDFHDFRDVVV